MEDQPGICILLPYDSTHILLGWQLLIFATPFLGVSYTKKNNYLGNSPITPIINDGLHASGAQGPQVCVGYFFCIVQFLCEI